MGNRRISGRPDVAYEFTGRAAVVVIDGEPVADLLIEPELAPLFKQFSGSAGEEIDESAFLCLWEKNGTKRDKASAFLDTLVGEGLAVRYSCALGARSAGRIGRWTSHLDDAYSRLERSAVVVIGPQTGLEALFRCLHAWPLRFRAHTQDHGSGIVDALQVGPRPDLIICRADAKTDLEAISAVCTNNGWPLLPLREENGGWSAGPLFLTDVSPCPSCWPKGGQGIGIEIQGTSDLSEDEGWLAFSDSVADFLAGCPSRSPLLNRWSLDSHGRVSRQEWTYRNPRCSTCGRAVRFPENAVVNL